MRLLIRRSQPRTAKRDRLLPSLLLRLLLRLWQLLNVVVGEAKMAIFVSRKNKMEGFLNADATKMWPGNLRCRIHLEFSLLEMMNDLEQSGATKTLVCYFKQ